MLVAVAEGLLLALAPLEILARVVMLVLVDI